jgi:hypothetical protein
MSDHDEEFGSRVRSALHREADRLEVGKPDLHRLRHDADARSEASGRLLAVVACCVVVGVGVLAVRTVTSDGVSFAGSGGTAVGGTGTVGEELHGRSFRSIGTTEAAPTATAEVGISFGVVSPRLPEPVFAATSDSGCPLLTGTYEMQDDGVLSVRGEASVDDLCGSAVEGGTGDRFVELLRSSPRLLLHGDRLVIDGSPGRVTFEEVSDVGEVAGCTAAIGDVVGSLQLFVGSVDPATEQADGSLTGRLDEEIAAAVLAHGCPEEEVREHAFAQLTLALVGHHGEEWVTVRQHIVSELTMGLRAEQFGVSSPSPLPMVQPGPTSTPTPKDDGGAAWCGASNMAGAVVTTAGALEAWCRDSSQRVTIDPGPGWRSVDIGDSRLVAERLDPATGARWITEFDMTSGRPMGRTSGSAPALSVDGRLAWITPAGLVAADGIQGEFGPPDYDPTSLSWDRAGRWLLTRDDNGSTVFASAIDDAGAPGSTRVVANLLAIAGEVDTPANILLLVDRGGSVALKAASLDGSEAFEPVDLASTGIPADTYGDASFIEPAGRLRPQRATGGWEAGTSTGWVIGDGTSAWYVDGHAAPISLGHNIGDVALVVMTE